MQLTRNARVERSIRWWYVFAALFFLRLLRPVLWPYMLSRGVTFDQKGYIYTISITVAVITMAMMAVIADRFSYKYSMMLGSAIGGAASSLFLVAPSWQYVAAAVSLFFVCEALCGPQIKSIAKLLAVASASTEEAQKTRFAQLMKRQQIVSNGALVSCGLLSGLLVLLFGTVAGVQVILIIEILMSLGGCFAAWRIIEPSRGSLRGATLLSFVRRKFSPTFWVFFVLIASAQFAVESSAIWQQPYLLAVGFSPGWASVMLGVVPGVWVLFLLVRPRVVYDRAWPIVILACVMPMSIAVMFFSDNPIDAYGYQLFLSGSLICTMGLVTARFLEEAQEFTAQALLAVGLTARILYIAYSPIAGSVMQAGAERQDTLGAIHLVQLVTGGALLVSGLFVIFWTCRYIRTS